MTIDDKNNSSTSPSPTLTESSSISTNSSISINNLKRKLMEDHSSDLINNTNNNKSIKLIEINKDTLFVLGKDLLNENKNLYSQMNVFKYEADNQDRQWLLDNLIIERKNFKVYLLLNEEFNKNNNNNHNNTSNDIVKSFKLPDFILNKLKRQYFLTKNNN
jgi:hypothetical protein